jgi:mannose-6-phosphate isomerase-like protein (cupin superfamily)
MMGAARGGTATLGVSEAASEDAHPGTELVWLFTYGPSTDPEDIAKSVPGWACCSCALLRDYAYVFGGSAGSGEPGTSALMPLAGSAVLGVAYLVSKASSIRFEQASPRHVATKHVISINGTDVPGVILEPRGFSRCRAPDLSYLGSVRRGLCKHYRADTIERYLARAVRLSVSSPGSSPITVDTRPFLNEHGISFRRLFPWSGTGFKGFGAGLAFIEPNCATHIDAHFEEEAFLVIAGSGVLHADGATTAVTKGDFMHLPPFSTHMLENDGDEPLEVLCIWSPNTPPAGADPVTR